MQSISKLFEQTLRGCKTYLEMSTNHQTMHDRNLNSESIGVASRLK